MSNYTESHFRLQHVLSGGLSTAYHPAKFVPSIHPEGGLDVIVGTDGMPELRFPYSAQDGRSMIVAETPEAQAIVDAIRAIFGEPEGPSAFYFEMDPDNADQVALSKFS